jgi:hypothetical protein
VIDLVIRLALAATAAVGTLWLANALVTHWTQRSIPDHLAGWWNSLYAEVETWLGANQHLGAVRVIAKITRVIDSAALAANKLLRVVVRAQAVEGPAAKISERKMNAAELLQMFPEFGIQKELTLAQTQ